MLGLPSLRLVNGAKCTGPRDVRRCGPAIVSLGNGDALCGPCLFLLANQPESQEAQ